MMGKLEELLAREKELKEALYLVTEEITQEKIHSVEEEYGVRVGSVVIYRGKEYRVTKVDVTSFRRDGKPWLEGNPRKKDGMFGIKSCRLYSGWELKTDDPV